MEQRDQHNMIPIEIPKCIGGKNAKIVCVNKQCKQGQKSLCQQQSCECQKQHTRCSFMRVFGIREQIKEQKMKFIERQKQQSKNIQDEIKLNIIKLQQRLKNFDLTASAEKFINSLKLQVKNIQDIHQIKNKYLLYSIKNEEKIKFACQKFKKQFDKICKQFEDNIKSYLLLDSKIIQKQEDRLWIQYLLQQVYQFAKIELILLYRASENNFEAKKFHQLCDANKDEIKNTLVIVKRDTQSNKIIGGYSTNTWNEIQGQLSKTDKQMKSFLFSLDLKEKYSLIDSEKKSIICSKSHGPIFGGDLQDLCIMDKANITESYSQFPSSYNLKEGDRYKYSREVTSNYIDFTGSQEGNFKVIQYEVYQIVKK